VADAHPRDVHHRAARPGREAPDGEAELAEALAHARTITLRPVTTAVTRAPLRVALGGGGTDLPSYYREHGGFVVSTAIDRYVQMLVSSSFQRRFRLKHLEWEEVDDAGSVRHPILRETLLRHWHGEAVELASVADAPPGTGLGSSGAYAVCAIKALRLAAGRDAGPVELAEAACEIEIEVLGRQIGKQDQYAAAFGGVRSYTFNPDDTVDVRELELSGAALAALRDDFLLFFSGKERSASDVLSGQVLGTQEGSAEVRRALDTIGELARETCAALEADDLRRVAALMNEHWEAKRGRAPGTVTAEMDDLRDLARRSGGLGVSSLGAGGGGFVLVYTEERERLRAAMSKAGAPELRFGLDHRGCVALS
jgi:D-glycero-alpha-D-manno-heptose-7-phosphate kinase